MSKTPRKPQTIAVQSGIGEDKAHNAVIPPIYLSSTYEIADLDSRAPYEYSRTRNPSRDTLAKALADLEGGHDAVITSSGMAALTIILHMLSPDDLIVAPYDCYGRSYALMKSLSDKGHFKLKFADQYSDEGLKDTFAENPHMVLIESPSNPVMRIADIQKISDMAKNHDTLVVVDNTFLSPMLQRPIELGADLVYHSSTKFLNGHSDVVGGCVIAKTKDIADELHSWNNALGTIGSAFDSFLTLRGIRTLDVRLHRAQENSQVIAEFLQNHDLVDRVYYPGLESHEGHALAQKQQYGAGAMISFLLKGNMDDVNAFARSLSIFRLAQSLGGTESLMNHPATMTHASMGDEAKAKAGVSDGLLRLSVGLEHIDDLIADLQNGFTALNKKTA